MRAVVQRVTSAEVVVGAERVGAIDKGLLVLVGVVDGDGDHDLTWMARKLVALRIFVDEDGRMNRSVIDVGGGLLMVSQFTVCADVNKGTRPSFARAMEPHAANVMFERLVEEVGKTVPVATGRFRAHMQVRLTNDGPVTLWLDSRQRGRA